MSGSASGAALTFLSASVFSVIGLLITYMRPQTSAFLIAGKRAVVVGLVVVGSLLGVTMLFESYYDFEAKFTAVLAMVVGVLTIYREYRFEIRGWRVASSVARNRELLRRAEAMSVEKGEK